ncbi:MAG: hypothetical protein RML40_03250 [Bacteroidota bacterium]|nr:hypothetical protein [Candidatus Kapabacteria bacterium]MDW8219527.1 hypothetical protein [Bacteroidota bacterium]
MHGRGRNTYSELLCGVAITVCIACIAINCDGGLAPPPIPPPTSISGVVRFVGGAASWPPRDSVWTMRVVAFRQFPPQDLIGDLFQGRAYFTPSALQLDSTLALFSDSARYSLVFGDSIPPRISYLCVALLVDTAKVLSTQGWRVVGVYTTTGNQREPSSITIIPGRDHRADMTVDFKNPPPQPF